MAIKILDNCINCAACEEECPSDAIHRGDEIYVVDPGACTMCKDEYPSPKCVEVCPIEDCIVAAAA